MSLFDFSQKVVLVTGGTRGIGLETALAFAEHGAKCILTYHWGDHDDEEINQAFRAKQASLPLLFQANVANSQDTNSLMAALKEQYPQIDIFISNVSVTPIVQSFEDYTLKGLNQSISYSAFPIVAYTQKIHQTFDQYPKYIIGISSTGPDHYAYGYDFVAASKTVMEVLCRYLSYRLKAENTTVNVVRSRGIRTKSLEDTFGYGKDLEPFVDKFIPDNYWIEPEEVAKAILALCSGYCDAIDGQIVTVDRGISFFDNFMNIYTRVKKGELEI